MIIEATMPGRNLIALSATSVSKSLISAIMSLRYNYTNQCPKKKELQIYRYGNEFLLSVTNLI